MSDIEKNDRVDAAIAEYLAACDAGRPPDRSRFLSQYPTLAASLVPFLDDHMQMKRAAIPLGPDITLLQGASTSSIGERVKYVGDYELLSEIAQGGMGVVYKARQASLNRDVAVKMILAGNFARPSDLTRFRLEAEAAANLDHPNILPIYEVGKHEDRPYFSMKLISGGSLSDVLANRQAMDQRQLVTLFVTICRAVHFAHQHGVLHRDLKPANILIDQDGIPYVTDFGLAKKTDSDDGATKTGAVLGTPSYMSPEQAKGEKGVSTAVDVYSLGAMLYEVLTGQPPFRGETVYDTIRQVIENEPAPPASIRPRSDRDLSAIAMKALSKRPEDRFASAEELAHDLERWLNGEATIARPPGLYDLAMRWVKRNALTAGSLMGLGLISGLSAVFTPFAIVTKANTFPLPPNTSLFNPLIWLNASNDNVLFRITVIAISVILIFGGGWLMWGIRRPKTPQAGLASGATVGLLTLLVAFAFFGPFFASLSSAFSHTRVHPIDFLEEIFQRGDSEKSLGNTFVPPRDVAYIEQLLTPEQRQLEGRERIRAIENVQRLAHDTNRAFTGLMVGWLVLGFLSVFILTWALHGAWVADHLMRSQRHPLSRFLTSLELIMLTLAFALFFLIVVGVTITVNSPNVIGGPSWWSRLMPLVGGIAILIVAHLGVVRYWHPGLRIGGYLGIVTLASTIMWLAGCFS